MCKRRAAIVMCKQDDANLCLACDHNVHCANRLAQLHRRQWICELCGKRPASMLCRSDKAALCGPCDEDVHSANELSHKHVRVSLEPFSALLFSEASQISAVASAWEVIEYHQELKVMGQSTVAFFTRQALGGQSEADGLAGLTMGGDDGGGTRSAGSSGAGTRAEGAGTRAEGAEEGSRGDAGVGFDLSLLGEDPYASFSPMLLQDPFEGLRGGGSGGEGGGSGGSGAASEYDKSAGARGGGRLGASRSEHVEDLDGSLFSTGVGDNEGTHAGASTLNLFDGRGDEDALDDSAGGKMDYEAVFAALGDDPYALWPGSGSDTNELQVVPDLGGTFEPGKLWSGRPAGNVFDPSSDDASGRSNHAKRDDLSTARRRAEYDQEEHEAELRQAFAYDEEAPAQGLGLPVEILGGAELAKDFDTNAYRKSAIHRYKIKKQRRQFMKTIRYQCRKSHAESRPRYKGRFVKQQPGETPEEALERAKREDAEAAEVAKAAKAAKAS